MSRRSAWAWRHRGDPHSQIHLPPLTAQEALLVANLLDRAIAALWRTHGAAMADLLACLEPDVHGRIAHADAPVASAGDHDDDDLF